MTRREKRINRNSKDKHLKNNKNEAYSKLVKGILAINGVCIGIGGYGAYHLYDKYNTSIEECIKEGHEKISKVSEKTFDSKNPTVIYGKNGKVIKEFKSSKYEYVKLKDTNKAVPNAFVSIEDERYYKHGAIDYTGLLRAGVVSVLSSGHQMQGGSTITQQLSKNMFLSMDRTITRKIKEAVIARELEEKFTKDEILEFYINNIYFANGCYGIESASSYYFNKHSKDLTISESAFLAGIPNNPYIYDPIHNYKNTIKRRNIILGKMKELGKISDKEYEEAIKTKIKLNIKKVDGIDANLPFATSFAIRNAVDDIMKNEGFVFRYKFKNDKDRNDYYTEYNKAYEIAQAKFKSGGYVVRTCIDPDMQHKLQKVIDSQMADYTAKNKNGVYKKQATAVTIDNKTGQVVAIVGGRTGSTYNRAFLAPRQSGSIIKPIIAYAPAFARGYVPSSLYNDAPISGGPYNWYKGYKGYVPLREGLTQSINTIAVRLVAENGVQKSLDYLRNMQFRYIMPSDTSSIVGIGGFTKGTTTVEMASAFSTIERNGEFIEPTNIQEIKNNMDETIYKNDSETTRVYDSGASYLTTSCLQSVINQEGATGYKVRMRNWSKNQAGKTGTTDGARDAWFAGYTPYFTTVVWVGDDNPRPQPGMAGAGLPGMIWRNWMESIHNGLKDKKFTKPSSVYESNGNLYDTAYNLKNIIKNRKAVEQNRIEEENAKQNARLKEVVYRTVYHLTDEEEKDREDKFKDKLEKSQADLNNLKTFVGDKNKYKDVFKDVDDLKKLLDEIKKPSANKMAERELSVFTNSVNQKYSLVLQDERRIKEEEEAKKKAEEEAKIRAKEEADRKKAEEKAKVEAKVRKELEAKIRSEVEAELRKEQESKQKEDKNLNDKNNQSIDKDNIKNDNEKSNIKEKIKVKDDKKNQTK